MMRWFVSLKVFLIPYICCAEGINVFTDQDAESVAYRALLSDAYQGAWDSLNNKSLPYDGFRQIKGKQMKNGADEPFTGWYCQYDDKEIPRLLCSFYDGIRDGPHVHWDERGNLSFRGAYQSGEKHGVFTSWDSNGTKLFEKGYFNGKLDGWSFFWYESGSIRLRLLFEKGNLVEATGWLPSGKMCPHTRVEKGSGVIIHHETGLTIPRGLSKEVKMKTTREQKTEN